MKTEQNQTIQTNKFYRAMSFDRGTINTETRTVELSFSSEEPYERWFGMEILSHDDGAIRMDRLNNGAPFLLNHNTDEQIGVVEKAFIGQDKRGRAVVRFSKSARAEEIYQDVLDGIRRNVSVGYLVHRMTMIEQDGDIESYRVEDWEPLEISSVPVPADNTVGVGRGGVDDVTTIIKTRYQNMENENKQVESKQPEVDLVKVRAEARKEELARVREIMAIGDKHHLGDIAQQFVDNGKGVEEFRAVVLEELGKRGSLSKVDEKAPLGLSDREVQGFSFARAIKALATGKRSLAPFEFEVSDALAQKLHKEARGILVPMDVMVRDLTIGSSSAGGNLKGTDFLSGSFIDVLRNKMLIRQLGAIILDGLVGDVAIPSQTAATSAYWVTEGNAPTEGAPTFGQVTLQPKSVAAFVDISRKLLLQSAPAIEALMRNDLASSLAVEIDRAAINGVSSSDEPEGILNTSGIGSVVGGTDGLAPAWSHVVALEKEVAVDNADVGRLAYLTNPKVRGKLKTVFTNATYGSIPVWQNGSESGVGMMNGYNAFVTNQVPSTLTKGDSSGVCSAIIFGNFADLILGFWGALDLNVDTATLSTSGGIRIVAFQDCDVAVRHAASFAAMVDALTA